MIKAVTMKWKYFWLSFSLKLHWLYMTMTLLTSPSKINIWPKTDELFSFLLFGWRYPLRLFIFRDIACEDSQDLTNHWQEHQKLPWSRSKVDKLYEEQIKTWKYGETWSCELLRCLARDRKCFHREFHYTNTMVLDLFWRWEVKIRLLRNDAFHLLFIRLHGNIFQIWKRATCLTSYQSRPRGSRAFRLSSRTIDKSPWRRTIPKIGYLCLLIGSEA